jgi:excisionase family DNA binding protein
MVMADEEVLTVPEVAQRLRVTEGSVREWLRTGRLRGFRPGGTKAGWRVPRSSLQAFIEASGMSET